jgi:phasin family protein
MTTVNEQVNDFQKTAVDAAVRFARMSLDGAERMIALNLQITKASLDDGAKNLQAISSVKDAQDLNNLRTKLSENSLEQAMGYSRSVYELATSTQTEISQMIESQVAGFQKDLAESIEKIAKNAPAGSDVVVAAMKSGLAATTAAMDNMTKAAKQAASYADSNFKAAASSATKTVETVSGRSAAGKSASGKRK